jgi:hypothetical protein
MYRLHGWLFLIGTFSSSACHKLSEPVAVPDGDEISRPPLEIKFRPLEHLLGGVGDDGGTSGVPSCKVPEGRQQVYDPNTGVFHIQFVDGGWHRSAFEITKVAERFAKPVVFRLTSVPTGWDCMGLELSVGDKRYALEEDHSYVPVDKTLFLVDRKEDVVTIDFTEKGQALLKPGTRIFCSGHTGW